MVKNRRVLKSRDSSVAQSTARWLAKKNLTPNTISLISIVFAALSFFSFYFASTEDLPLLPALLIAVFGIQLRLVCNLMDGMIAIEYGKKTIYGDIYNEFPDRISDSLILIGASLLSSSPNGLAIGLAACFFSIFTAYVRLLAASQGLPQHFLGPMAKQHRMALISITCLVFLVYQKPLINNFNLFDFALIIICAGCVITVARRLHKMCIELKFKHSTK